MKKSLEEKVAEISMQSVEKIVVCSFLMLLYDNFQLMNHDYTKIENNEKRLYTIAKAIQGVFVNLENVIDAEADKKEELLNNFLNLKKDIIQIAAAAQSYQVQTNIMELSVEREIMVRDLADLKKDLPTINMEKFINRCYQFIEQSDANGTASENYMMLLSVLPVIYDDEEFANYIVSALRRYLDGALKSEVLDISKNVHQWFAPDKIDGYSDHFPAISKLVETQVKQDFWGLDDKRLDKFLDQETTVFDTVNAAYDYIYTLYSDVNFISIMLSSMMTYYDIIGSNAIYEDLYRKSVQITEDPAQMEAFIETVNTTAEDLLESNMDQLKELSERQNLIFNNVDFKHFTVNTQTLISMEFFLSTTFYANLAQDVHAGELEPEDNEQADEAFIETELSKLRSFIMAQLNMDNQLFHPKHKLAQMQYALSMVPCPFDLNKMKEYVKGVVAQAESFEEKAVIIERATYIFDAVSKMGN